MEDAEMTQGTEAAVEMDVTAAEEQVASGISSGEGSVEQAAETSKREADGGADAAANQALDIQGILHAAMEEFRRTELAAERAKREELEQRVSELSAENARSHAVVEEAERSTSIRSELQRLGVVKVELAYKAVKDDIERNEQGQLQARGGVSLKEYLAQFVGENPELLPARIAGGSGASPGHRQKAGGVAVDLDHIQPGMSAEEMHRIRLEIARVATQTLRGL